MRCGIITMGVLYRARVAKSPVEPRMESNGGLLFSALQSKAPSNHLDTRLPLVRFGKGKLVNVICAAASSQS